MDTHLVRIDDIVACMRRNPKEVRFNELCRVCKQYFGEACQKRSHRVYRTPWQGDPRVNIQNDKGSAWRAMRLPPLVG